MKFSEVVSQTLAWLQREGRVSYRALRLEFDLNEDVLDALKEEIIEVKEAAVDRDGKMLVWTSGEPKGETGKASEVVSSQLSVVSPQPPTPNTQPPAERRQLTVMFCDLVDSTLLSARLDPEEWREIVQAYQAVGAHIIEQYEGRIAQYLGDGLLVYFGYPVAHEDDAQRAVRSGLAIVKALQQAPLLQRHGVQVRIGIHTGLVVVGEVGGGAKREQLALGDTPNIAARLQGLAHPNTIVMSDATQQLVAGLFDCDDLGLHSIKGISAPVQVYQVKGESGVRSRLEVASRRGLTPLIGREHEVQLLLDRWEQAKTGAGQVVLLSGEPGIGKSRLVHRMKEQGTVEEATWIEFRCVPFSQNTAFAPVIEHLQRLLQFAREDSPTVKLGKLQHTLSQYRFPQTDTLSLLASLLSLPQPEGVPSLTFSPQKQKQRTEEALVAWLVEEAERQAVVTVWEDLHWADPSTLEFLSLLLDQVPTTRLFVVLTARPEFQSPWPSRGYWMTLILNRLPRSQAALMVQQVTRDKAVPAEVLQQIVARTDGVPLFIEELTKSIIEAVGATGRSPLQLAIPATLHDSLMARLDRLESAKEIAQLAATLGREFSYELLHAVSPLDEETLQHGLKQLVEAELVYQRGLLPQAHYLFKHALIQDTAYQSLLKSTRQQYHRQIAQVLEGRFTETIEIQPELVAHHYTEAGLIAQAIPYWQQAGERATQRSAYVEAVAHFTTGLEVLKALPDTPERTQQELTLQLALSYALLTVKGWAAPEVGKAGTRAPGTVPAAGETPQLFPVLFRLIEFYLNRGELLTLRELAEQLMRLAQSVQDPYPLSVAHLGLGATLCWLGELPSARLHVEQALALYDPQQHSRPSSTTADPRLEGLTPERAPWLNYRWASNTADPRIECLSYATWTLWPLGYPDQALKRNQEVLALAEGLSQPFGLAYALGMAAWCHLLRREGPLARERAEAMMTLATEQGFPYWLGWATLLRGGALAAQGQVEEGILQIQRGIATYRATGAEALLTYFLALLAEAHEKAGQIGEGLSVLTEALAQVEKTGERYYEAELYRLYGELSLRLGERESGRRGDNTAFAQSPSRLVAPSSPEECFHKAIEIARKQQAKSLELRAVMSLSRLWQQQDKQAEAHQMLSEIYNWFTEGFDTKDLQEAKAMLEILKGNSF